MSFALSKGTATFGTGIKIDGSRPKRNSLKYGFFRQLGATRRWVDQSSKRYGRVPMRTIRLMMESDSPIATPDQTLSTSGGAGKLTVLSGHFSGQQRKQDG